MAKAIDNFLLVRDNLLRFEREGEFYLVLILRRRKDIKGIPAEGVNEDNRLIKHYFIYDREYLDRKRDAIVALCDQNNARAYILPQRRSHDVVMWALHNKTGEILRSGARNTHFDHLIRSCVAGTHETPPDCKHHKRWVIDIDADDADTQKIAENIFVPGSAFHAVAECCGKIDPIAWYAEWLAIKLREALILPSRYPMQNRPSDVQCYMPNVGAFYDLNDISVLPTPNGFHVVTPPFNRERKAMERYFGMGCPIANWIKPDAMTLLYAPKDNRLKN